MLKIAPKIAPMVCNRARPPTNIPEMISGKNTINKMMPSTTIVVCYFVVNIVSLLIYDSRYSKVTYNLFFSEGTHQHTYSGKVNRYAYKHV